MPRRSAKTMRRRVKSPSKKMAQSIRMRRGAPAKKNVPKKKTQKRGSDWHKQVMVVFKEMRQQDPNVQLQDAMKEASKRKGKGVLLSPVQNVSSSQFSTVPAPKKKKAKQKALSDLGPRPAKTASGKDRGYGSEGASKLVVGPFPAPNPKKKAAKKATKKATKKAKKTKKKMTPPPIPPNNKGKKIPSKKKSSKKKWAKQYNSEGEVKLNNPLNSDYLSSGTE